MLHSAKIEKFYNDVNSLDVKFPVATISKATGYSQGNVSEYVRRKKEPSESFLKAFYDWFEKLPRETSVQENTGSGIDLTGKYLLLLEEENARIKKRQSESLEEMRTILLMNQAILKTLRKAVAQLISKSEKSDLLEVAHRLDIETSEVFLKLSGKDSSLFDK